MGTVNVIRKCVSFASHVPESPDGEKAARVAMGNETINEDNFRDPNRMVVLVLRESVECIDNDGRKALLEANAIKWLVTKEKVDCNGTIQVEVFISYVAIESKPHGERSSSHPR